MPLTSSPSSFHNVLEASVTGADATAAVQALLNNAVSGDTIFFPPGTYTFSAQLSFVAPVNFIGADPQTTTLIWPTAGILGVVIPAGASGSRVAHLTIQGPNTTQTASAGISAGSTNDIIVEDCIIQNWDGPGINTGGSSQRWFIRNNVVKNNFNQGIFLGGGTNYCEVSGNKVIGNAYNGIDVNGSWNLITNNVVTSNGSTGGSVDRWGILIAGVTGYNANYNISSHNTVAANGAQGIIVRAVMGQTASGNVIIGNISNGNTGSSTNGDGIGIDGSAPGALTANVVIGNILEGNQRYGLYVDRSVATVTLTLIANNVWTSNGTGDYADTAGTSYLNEGVLVDDNTYSGFSMTAASNAGVTAANYSLIGNGSTTSLGRPSGGYLTFTEANANEAILAPGGNFGIGPAIPATLFSISGANGQQLGLNFLTELTTIAAAATTTTTIQIPAGAIVLAVSVRVTVVIPTSTSFSVGDAGSATRYSTTATVSVAASTTDAGTKAGAFYNASATGILLTMAGSNPATNTGRVRVTIAYFLSTPPTS